MWRCEDRLMAASIRRSGFTAPEFVQISYTSSPTTTIATPANPLDVITMSAVPTYAGKVPKVHRVNLYRRKIRKVAQSLFRGQGFESVSFQKEQRVVNRELVKNSEC